MGLRFGFPNHMPWIPEGSNATVGAYDHTPGIQRYLLPDVVRSPKRAVPLRHVLPPSGFRWASTSLQMGPAGNMLQVRLSLNVSLPGGSSLRLL